MVATRSLSRSQLANGPAADAVGRPAGAPGPALGLAIELEDVALEQAVLGLLPSWPDLREAPRSEGAAIVTDTEPDEPPAIPVLLIGLGAGSGGDSSVLPTRDPGLILSAAALVAAGYRVVPARMPLEEGEELAAAIPHLSLRERQVAALLVEGASNKVIARRLGISVHTAKFHVNAVIAKLGAHNRSDAVTLALRNGVVAL